MNGLWLSIQLGISSSQLTHIFQRGWNHQPDSYFSEGLKPPTRYTSYNFPCACLSICLFVGLSVCRSPNWSTTSIEPVGLVFRNTDLCGSAPLWCLMGCTVNVNPWIAEPRSLQLDATTCKAFFFVEQQLPMFFRAGCTHSVFVPRLKEWWWSATHIHSSLWYIFVIFSILLLRDIIHSGSNQFSTNL